LPLALAAGGVDDDELAVAVHHHVLAVLAVRRSRLLQRTRPSYGSRGRSPRPCREPGAADVEGAHRELRAGLADRLRRDDADGLADVDHVPAREVAAVAQRADAAPRRQVSTERMTTSSMPASSIGCTASSSSSSPA
jgi:hypothetical protein